MLSCGVGNYVDLRGLPGGAEGIRTPDLCSAIAASVVSRSCSGSDCPARSPPPLSTMLSKQAGGIAGLSAAMRGLIAARIAVMTAVAAIDADIRRMTRASAACRRLITIPGVGQLTALAFVAAIEDPSRIRRSRDVGAYLGLVPRRYQSGEVDYTGGISKCGDRRVRTLLYEAANVMLTRYKGQLKLKDWASRSPSDQRCAKRESLWLAALGSSCTRCCETEPSSHRPKQSQPRDRRPNLAPRGATP